MESWPGNSTERRVGWLCTYTPEEIIQAAGFTPYRLLPLPGERSADDLFPPNLCPYVRQVAQGIKNGYYGNLEGVVVAHSCNAMMHLYNVLQEEEDPWVYLLDVPRHKGEDAQHYFARELEGMAEYLGEKGREVNQERLKEALHLYGKREQLWRPLLNGWSPVLHEYFPLGWYGLAEEASITSPEQFNEKLARILEMEEGNQQGEGVQDSPTLLLTGGLPPRGLVELFSETADYFWYPENCGGARYLLRRVPSLTAAEEAGSEGERDDQGSPRRQLLKQLAASYLEKPPCPRVFHYSYREDWYRQLLEDGKVKGVVYHDLMFCDMSHYDYLLLKDIFKEKEVPFLQVETELAMENLGQIKTRLEAFLELIE